MDHQSTTTTAARWVPAVGWLGSYERDWLGNDVVGGLAAGSVVIPQAMAYATIADLPAEVGLYTCMVPMLVYALLGGSRTLSVSTTSTVAVLTGSTLLAASVASSSDDPARDLASLTILVGVILLIARLLRLGSIIDNISDATLTGIKAGVGLTVAAGQLPKLLGVEGDATAEAFFGEVRGVFDDLDQTSGATLALSVVTIVLLVALARFAPIVPAPLVAVGLGIALVAGWSIDADGVALIAPVPSGLPTPVLPRLEGIESLVGGALAIALMCFMETASVAGAVRRRSEPQIDNNQELTANALACVLGGLFRSMPAAGGFSQTAMNQRAGARTQLSAFVTVALAVACALFLGGVLSDLPAATLGSLVVVAVIGLIQPMQFVRYWRLDKLSFWIAVVTTVGGLVLGLLAAVLIGVIATLLLVLRELNRIGVTELQLAPGGGDLVVAAHDTHPLPGLLILRAEGPLYTANIRRVRRSIMERVEAAEPEVVLFDATAMVEVSIMVVDELDEMDTTLAERGVELWYAALSPLTLQTARRLPQWGELDEAGRMHETSLAAVRAYRSR